MHSNLPFATSTSLTRPFATIPYERVGFCWGAVLAGLTTAVGLDVFFAEVGLALNLGIIDRNDSGGAIAVANGIAWVITGLVALFVGAWVAGRMATARTQLEGGLHGLAVWGAGAAAAVLLAIGSVGVAGSGMLSLVGDGLTSAAAVVQVAEPKWDSIKAELDQAVGARLSSPTSTSADTTSVADADTRDANQQTGALERSRLFELAGSHFALDGSSLGQGERAEMVQLLAAQTGMSADVAERTLRQWDSVWARSVQTFETARQAAADAAEKARLAAIAAASWAAVAMLLGAAAALFGGAYGARCRLRGLERDHQLLESSAGLHPSFPGDGAGPRVATQPVV